MSLATKYRTVKNITEGQYREKGSKFLAFVIPCDNSADAKNHVDQLWKKHPGAVHVCYAWRFGKKKMEERFSDDGEPSNTAGKPIFGQILAFDLTNVLIAVVRYYGGTNLGVGGLIQAYKTAAKEALDQALIIEQALVDFYKIQFAFDQTGDVMNLLQRRHVNISAQDYSEHGTIVHFSIAQNQASFLAGDFEHLPNIIFEKTGSDT